EALDNLEKVHNRRKALVWVSEGYDFTPFQKARLGLMDPSSPFLQNSSRQMENQMNCQNADPSGNNSSCGSSSADPLVQQQQQTAEFAAADLFGALADVTRGANRSNVTIYTIDPRGLVAGSDIDEQVDPTQWNDYVRKSQDTMRVLAEETGGVAVVNQNDFDKALQQIDAASSDYYVLGYYSSNPDPTKRRRQVDVKVLRKDTSVYSRKEYVLKAPPRTPAPPPTPTQQKK